ncbi:MAG: HD domain-containing phosphohydrolase [Nitrospiria bacterium]
MDTMNVLVVDIEPTVASLAQVVKSLGFSAVVATDGRAALDRIRTEEFALVIANFGIPGLDGIDLIRRVKAFAPEIEVIVVTALPDVERAKDLIRLGAADYLSIPYRESEVARSVRRSIDKYRAWKTKSAQQQDIKLLIERQTRQINDHLITSQEKCGQLRGQVETLRTTYDATLEALIVALDSRGHEPLGHAQRLAVFSEEIAKTLSVCGPPLDAIRHGAMLHNIGNINVPEAIFTKAGKLTEDEWVSVRRHARFGYQIIQSIPYLQDAAQIVLQHHERYDGKGYPHQTAGDGIVLGARIFAVADTFEAMTSERPYRPAATYQEVCAELARCAGSQFDPLVVEAFLRIPESTWTALRRAVEVTTCRWKDHIAA